MTGLLFDDPRNMANQEPFACGGHTSRWESRYCFLSGSNLQPQERPHHIYHLRRCELIWIVPTRGGLLETCFLLSPRTIRRFSEDVNINFRPHSFRRAAPTPSVACNCRQLQAYIEPRGIHHLPAKKLKGAAEDGLSRRPSNR